MGKEGAARWLYEAGIGEDRAALISNGQIIRALVDRRLDVACGTVCSAKLTKWLGRGRGGIVQLEGGQDALLRRLPDGVTEGAMLTVEIRREAVAETGRYKLPIAEATDLPLRDAPDLLERISAQGLPVDHCHAHEADKLAAVGWNEVMEEAQTGYVAFAGGSLQISLTPAMTLIDVDGELDPRQLGPVAARACAQAINRLGLAGNIGIDFPNGGEREQRQMIAAEFDASMGGTSYERTAVNGYGFMQVILRRERPSLPEIFQGDLTLSHAIGLLRMASRDRSTGPMMLIAHPAVISRLMARQDWLDTLATTTGRSVGLQADAGLAIAGYYVAAC